MGARSFRDTCDGRTDRATELDGQTETQKHTHKHTHIHWKHSGAADSIFSTLDDKIVAANAQNLRFQRKKNKTTTKNRLKIIHIFIFIYAYTSHTKNKFFRQYLEFTH